MSTYSTNLGTTLISTGDQSGVWGNTTNYNLGTLMEQAIASYVTQQFSSADVTLYIASGSDAGGNTTPGTIYSAGTVAVPVSARNLYIECQGTSSGNNLIVPNNTKLYYVYNNIGSGGGTITVKTASGTGIAIPNGKRAAVFCNGTNVVQADNYFSTFTSPSVAITGGTIDSVTIGSTTASTVKGTTITATSQFTGPGTGLTGTASSLTAGAVSLITYSQVISALGYTPGTGGGSVTSVSGTGTVSGLTLSGTVTTSGSLTLGGTLSLTSSNVTTALGYTPPTPTGTGASGTWAISISGNAATASSATTAGSCSGNASTASNPYGGGSFITTSNYTSYSPTLTGSGASGTWGISVSGTASYATYPASGGSFITSSNIGSQSVNYASSAGTSSSCSGNASTASNPYGGGSFITSSNIGSQSVSYASSAGSASSASTANSLNSGNSYSISGLTNAGNILLSAGAATVQFNSGGPSITVTSPNQFNFTTDGSTTSMYIDSSRNLNVIGSVYQNVSDMRLKNKVGDIDTPLDKVCSLSGFYYELNSVAQALGFSVKREVGLSAQDVQAVMPEVIAPAPIDNQYITLDYARLVPLLVEAIKELKSQVDALKPA